MINLDLTKLEIDGKPLTELDLVYLVQKYQLRTKDDDESARINKVLDYWQHLGSSGE